jgi:uncharacterized membrane protein YebE (DUF533 family)
MSISPERLLGALLEGALGGRHGRHRALRHLTGGTGSLINPSTLLAAAGVAWGVYEVATQGSPGQWAGGAPASGAAPPPIPGKAPSASTSPSSPAGLSPELLRLVRLTISAARADGDLSLEERGAILENARKVGAEAAVVNELQTPRPLSEIVAGVRDPALKEQMYTLAATIARADSGVSGAERIYLAQLAHQLGLDAAAAGRLESEVAARLDAEKPAK